jgi:hypothetical protein
MSTIQNLHSIEAIEKLKSLVDEIKIFLFYTNLKQMISFPTDYC